MQCVYSIVFITAILVCCVCGVPSNIFPQLRTSASQNPLQQLAGSNAAGGNLLTMLGIENLIQCFQKNKLDPSNLPSIETLTNDRRKLIFSACTPLLQLADASIANDNEEEEETHYRRRRSKRRTKSSIGRRSSQSSPTSAPTPTVSNKDVIENVLRLQFLFLTSFFATLANCIATDGFPQSRCILESLSTALSVVTLELG